jgi:hypothetical protein
MTALTKIWEQWYSLEIFERCIGIGVLAHALAKQ